MLESVKFDPTTKKKWLEHLKYLLDNQSPEFFASCVKELCIPYSNSNDPETVHKLLSVCTGIKKLAIWIKDPTLSPYRLTVSFRLTKLSTACGHLERFLSSDSDTSGIIAWTQTLTHLHLILWIADPNVVPPSSIKRLSALTHVCVSH